MKKLLGLLSLCLILTGCGSDGSSTNNSNGEKDSFTIGIVQHMPHPALDSSVSGFKDFLNEKGVNVEFLEKNAQGDTTTNGMITDQFVNDGVDMIYAIATPSALAAVNSTLDSDLPVVFNAVTDPVDAGLVASAEKPGKNVTGVSDAAPLETQVKLIREFLPEAKKIGMIYNIGEPNGKLQVEQVEEIAPNFGFTVEKKGISAVTEIASAAQQLAASCDCIYNITDNSVVSATAAIVDKANNENIPVFAAEDGQMSSGLLASDSLSYYNLGKQAGQIAYDILVDGKNPGDIAVEGAQETALYVNKKVAEALEIEIPASVDERCTYLD